VINVFDNILYLKENIILSGSTLLDVLLEARVLDQRELDDIQSNATHHNKTEQLLKMIMRSSEEQYQLFLESLKISSHEHVYIKLRGMKFCIMNSLEFFVKDPNQMRLKKLIIIILQIMF